MMRRAWARALLLAFIPIVSRAQSSRKATDWQPVSVSSEADQDLNVRRLRRESPTLVDAWIRTTYHSPRRLADTTVVRLVTNYLFECDKVRSRILQQALYGPDTSSYIKSTTFSEKETPWSSEIPGTVGENQLMTACRLAPKSR
jgi:hypothetical protein